MKLSKIVLIVIVFCCAMIVLISSRDRAGYEQILHSMVFVESNDDWEKCELENCAIESDSSAVKFDVETSGNVTTYMLNPGFEFDQAILSWNVLYAKKPKRISFETEVSADSVVWHRFDYLAWGDSTNNKPGAVKSINGIGRIDVDVLKLVKKMKYARVIVESTGGEKGSDFYLRRLALSFSSDDPKWKEIRENHAEAKIDRYGDIRLSVPYISQRSLEANKTGGACSPTSVSMILGYFRDGINPEDFAWAAFDKNNDMFGNWPYNVQAAYESGMSRVWAERHCGFDEIHNEVIDGKPVVISIAYGYDELPNSPIHEAENGHLVVVVGFAGMDTVICNDPAGHGVEDGIINYPRKELEKAWIGHTGVAYHLWP